MKHENNSSNISILVSISTILIPRIAMKTTNKTDAGVVDLPLQDQALLVCPFLFQALVVLSKGSRDLFPHNIITEANDNTNNGIHAAHLTVEFHAQGNLSYQWQYLCYLCYPS